LLLLLGDYIRTCFGRREATTLPLTIFALVSADCTNGIMAGQLNIQQNGASTPVYVSQSGGTQYGGVTVSGTSITLAHNVRAYLSNQCASSFAPDMFTWFFLLGKTLSYTADLSQVGCACNAAFYLVGMPAYNSANQVDPTTCGDYYCDANKVCGLYCPEMDLMEANNHVMQITPHSCSQPNGNFYPSCDGGGCGQNTYRLNPGYYCQGGGCTINTDQPFRVSHSFQTDANNNLGKITTFLSQNGKSVTITHDSSNCGSDYLPSMTQGFKNGLVLVMSYWGDSASTMSWLDIPPCDSNTNCNGNTVATFSDISIN